MVAKNLLTKIKNFNLHQLTFILKMFITRFTKKKQKVQKSNFKADQANSIHYIKNTLNIGIQNLYQQLISIQYLVLNFYIHF